MRIGSFPILIPTGGHPVKLLELAQHHTMQETPRSRGEPVPGRDRDHRLDIYVMNADGTGQVRLTNNPAGDWSPSWSPDGQRITFVSNRDSNWEIYVMNADGTGQVNLTNNPATDSAPAWSR